MMLSERNEAALLKEKGTRKTSAYRNGEQRWTKLGDVAEELASKLRHARKEMAPDGRDAANKKPSGAQVFVREDDEARVPRLPQTQNRDEADY